MDGGTLRAVAMIRYAISDVVTRFVASDRRKVVWAHFAIEGSNAVPCGGSLVNCHTAIYPVTETHMSSRTKQYRQPEITYLPFLKEVGLVIK